MPSLVVRANHVLVARKILDYAVHAKIPIAHFMKHWDVASISSFWALTSVSWIMYYVIHAAG